MRVGEGLRACRAQPSARNNHCCGHRATDLLLIGVVVAIIKPFNCPLTGIQDQVCDLREGGFYKLSIFCISLSQEARGSVVIASVSHRNLAGEGSSDRRQCAPGEVASGFCNNGSCIPSTITCAIAFEVKSQNVPALPNSRKAMVSKIFFCVAAQPEAVGWPHS